MANNHKASLAKLGKKLSTLNDGFDGLGDGSDIKELLRIIHRPGWTTIAELTLVHGIVDSMNAHIEAIAGLKASLVKGSQQVGAQEG
jgi:hypothetical protein